jgi:hypothetical protein
MPRTLISVLLILFMMPAAAKAQGLPQPSGFYVAARDMRLREQVILDAAFRTYEKAVLQLQARRPADPEECVAAHRQLSQMRQVLLAWRDDVLRGRDLYAANRRLQRAREKADRAAAMIANAMPLWP